MALDTIWTHTHYNQNGTSYEYRIRKDVETPADNPTTVEADQIPCLMKWGTENNDKYQAIQRSVVDLFLISETAQQYQDFFTSDVGSYFLEVYQNGGLYWIGVGITDQYLESLLPPPYVVRLTFTDGLQLLSGLTYFHPNADTRQTTIEIINHALARTGLSLALSTAINVYSTDMWTNVLDNDSPLDETTLDPEQWYQGGDHNFLEALTDICEIFGARLFQWEGQWYMHRVNEYAGDYLQRNWDTDGSFLSSGYVETTVLVNEIKGDNGDMSILPKANNIRVESGGSTQNNLLVNSYFERWSGGVPIGMTFSDGGGSTITELTDEQVITGSKAIEIDWSGSTDYLQFTTKDYWDGASFTDIETLSTNTYTLKFRVKPKDAAAVSNIITMDYSVLRGSYWLDSNGNWTNVSEQVLRVSDREGDRFDYIEIDVSLDFTAHPGASDEPITIKIFASGTDVILDSVEFFYVPGSPFERLPRVFGISNTQAGGGDVNKSVTLTSIGARDIISENTPRDAVYDTTPTDNALWKRRDTNVGGETTYRHLGELLADSIEDETSQNQIRLNMTLVDVGHRMIWPLRIPGVGSGRFIANGVTFNPALNEWSGEWIEIVSSPKYSELAQS